MPPPAAPRRIPRTGSRAWRRGRPRRVCRAGAGETDDATGRERARAVQPQSAAAVPAEHYGGCICDLSVHHPQVTVNRERAGSPALELEVDDLVIDNIVVGRVDAPAIRIRADELIALVLGQAVQTDVLVTSVAIAFSALLDVGEVDGWLRVRTLDDGAEAQVAVAFERSRGVRKRGQAAAKLPSGRCHERRRETSPALTRTGDASLVLVVQVER